MKGAHREGKDSASCGHKSAGGCPTVFINGFPAMRAYGDSDRAGGQLLGPGAKNVFVGNARLSLKGDSVLSHGRGEHASATIVTGSPDVLAAPNPPVADQMSLDEQMSLLAGRRLAAALRFLNQMGKGAWDLLVKLGTNIREHPIETAGLVLLTILFPELGLILAAGGATASLWRLGWLTHRLLTEDLSQAEIDALARQYGHDLGEFGLSVGGFFGAIRQLRLLNKSTLVSLRPLLGDLMSAIREFNGPKIAGILNELGGARLTMLKDQATGMALTLFRGKAFLDRAFGPERTAFIFKAWEKKPNGQVIINRTRQIALSGTAERSITLHPRKTYIWGIDGDGNLLVAEEILGGPRPHMKLGHPSLNGGGPMRIAGDLHFDPSTNSWVMNNMSGRYHAFGPPADYDQLRRAALLLKSRSNITGEVNVNLITF